MAGRESTSDDDDKDALECRLHKMEGQIRGRGQMIEDDGYRLDVAPQLNVRAAATGDVRCSCGKIM